MTRRWHTMCPIESEAAERRLSGGVCIAAGERFPNEATTAGIILGSRPHRNRQTFKTIQEGAIEHTR